MLCLLILYCFFLRFFTYPFVCQHCTSHCVTTGPIRLSRKIIRRFCVLSQIIQQNEKQDFTCRLEAIT